MEPFNQALFLSGLTYYAGQSAFLFVLFFHPLSIPSPWLSLSAWWLQSSNAQVELQGSVPGLESGALNSKFLKLTQTQRKARLAKEKHFYNRDLANKSRAWRLVHNPCCPPLVLVCTISASGKTGADCVEEQGDPRSQACGHFT